MERLPLLIDSCDAGHETFLFSLVPAYTGSPDSGIPNPLILISGRNR